MLRNKIFGAFAVAAATVLIAGTAHAQLGKTISAIDGDVATGGWAAADAVPGVAQTASVSTTWGPNSNISGLRVTWDLNYLYICTEGNNSTTAWRSAVVLVDGNFGATANVGWDNTTSSMTSTQNRFAKAMSNTQILFPAGFKPDLFTGMAFGFTADGGGGANDAAGQMTYNAGVASDFGFDVLGNFPQPAGPTFQVSRSPGQQVEWRIRWDRIFSAQADGATYNFADGTLPASCSSNGRIALLVGGISNLGPFGSPFDENNTYVSNQFLPPLTFQNLAPGTSEPGYLTNVTSGGSATGWSLTGVIVIDVDQDNNGRIDTTGSLSDAGRVTISNNPPVLGVSSSGTFFNNNFIQVNFSEAPLTGVGAGSATNVANYTLTGGLTVTSVAMGTGSRANQAFLTLNADVPLGGSTLTIQNITSADGTKTVPVSNFPVSQRYYFNISVDSTTDTQQFLTTPYVIGSWDGYGNRWPLVDGTDAYPEVPGVQAAPGDTAGDRIYVARYFLNANPGTPGEWTAISDFDFGTPSQPKIRGLGKGYWFPHNFDQRSLSPTDQTIVDTVQNRILPNNVTVTIQLDVPLSELTGLNINQDVQMFVQAGPTFGGEGAIPTLPATDLPGEADVTGGKQMAYLGTVPAGTPAFHRFVTQVTYPAGVPDVSTYRFGYTATGFGTLREEESDFTPSDLAVPPTGTKSNTIHGHVHRLAKTNGTRAEGRIITAEFRRTSFDVPPPAADALLAESKGWTLYE